MMNKLVRDGKVAVLYSPDYGSGWYTWNADHPELLFDPAIVQLVEEDKFDELQTYVILKYPKLNVGGLGELKIAWIPEGTMFREQGVEVGQNFQSASASSNIGVNTNAFSQNPQVHERSGLRQEMRGPQTTDIENILSGLKTKTVVNTNMDIGEDSMISVTSLRDMDGNMPKRSNRKPRQNKSDKNTVSLDI
jgi:hypothetical protein